jgi:hypothetical protein
MITYIIAITIGINAAMLFYIFYKMGYVNGSEAERKSASRILKNNPVKVEDLMYFQNKLDKTTDPIKREKIQKQIDLLEDALIVYRLHREIREIK